MNKKVMQSGNTHQPKSRKHHLTKMKSGEYEGLCLNPSQIPPDDLDEVILGGMIKEAGMLYKMELE